MKLLIETGVLAGNSVLFVPNPSAFAREHLFYSDRFGRYRVNRLHCVNSRCSPIGGRFAMFYLLKGEMLFIIGDREHIVHEHELAIVDLRQAYIWSALTDAEYIWFCFDGSCSDELVTRICSYSNVYSPSHISRIYNALNELFDGYNNQTPLYEEQISLYIYSILTDLLVMQKDAVDTNPSIIEQITKYIEENYHLPITIKDLAEMTCLNPCYFGQKFRTEMGISPKRYLIDTRLNSAKSLLTTTNLGIYEIAERVGFQTDNYFSNLFHKRFKMTPSEYRESVKKRA